MASSGLSQSPYIPAFAGMLSILPLGFGINALLRPRSAFNHFQFQLPASTADQKLVDGLMLVYGIRNVVTSVAILGTAWYGHRKALGCILVALSGVAIVDGCVAKDLVGSGEWGHWMYAPLLTTMGSLLLGVLG